MVAIVAWRADWSDAYSELARRLRAVAPPGACLHHIGSTAVPGLPAKDIIDMQMTVSGLSAVDAAALAGIGWVERHGLSDHLPPGRDLAPADLAKRFFKGTARPANLHVREAGRFNQRYPLLCRDYLRGHPAAAAAYAEVKARLAALVAEDSGAYSDAKDPVVDLMMVAAEDWAARTGWREPPEDR